MMKVGGAATTSFRQSTTDNSTIQYRIIWVSVHSQVNTPPPPIIGLVGVSAHVHGKRPPLFFFGFWISTHPRFYSGQVPVQFFPHRISTHPCFFIPAEYVCRVQFFLDHVS